MFSLVLLEVDLMLLIFKQFLAPVLAALIVLGLPMWQAQGQMVNPNFRVPTTMPGAGPGVATAVLGAQLQTGMATITSTPFGYTQSPNGSGYGGYNSYYPDPAGGYLRGVADLTKANSQYQVTIQQARLVQSQADMSKLDVRRRIFDEARYERMMTPSPEEVRVAEMTAALNRARREPPLGEIWSAKALNDLFLYLASQQAKGVRGPNISLDEDMLKRINLTSGVGGSIGILKDGGKLQWPLPLQNKEFDESRKRMDGYTVELVKGLKFNNAPDVATLKDMQADLKRLNDSLTKNVGDLSPTQFIEAKRYLNHLEDAIKALQDPNVGNFFTQKWSAKGKTVAELIKHMSDQGLRFAPAAPGDEPSYRGLYQAFNAFDAGVAQLTAGRAR
jgi:hypothetical protein